MVDNAFIFTNTRGSEEGQGIDMGVTGQVTMRNGALITAEANPGGSGDAGDLTVNVDRLTMRDGAAIGASTFGPGRGGDLRVTADTMLLEGVREGEVTGLFASARPGSTGDAGDLTVRAGSLEVLGGAQISAGTFGSGQGGNLLVEADSVLLSGSGVGISEAFPSGLFTEAAPGSNGDAGDLMVEAGSLEVREGALISAGTHSTGRGGNLTITATDIELNRDAGIFAGSSGTGLAGQIFIKTLDNLRLVNGGQISVATDQANAGDITLEVGSLLHLRDSSITSSVAGGTGDGGDITISNPTFVLLDRSQIIADAARGRSGNIQIKTDFLLASPDSRVEAGGRLEIDSPETDISGGISVLPAAFFDAATVLTELCAGRSGANVSSLVVRKYEVLPDSPYALRVQLPRAIPAPRTAKQSRAPRTHYAGGPLQPMISCLGNS